jgi:hypothetical protein
MLHVHRRGGEHGMTFVARLPSDPSTGPAHGSLEQFAG